MTILLTRSQVDEVLKTYCDQIGLSCSDLHDDAFCVQNSKGYWSYIWYNGDENIASDMISEIEKMVKLQQVNLQRSAP
jgi:restriction endonuclease Mrr